MNDWDNVKDYLNSDIMQNIIMGIICMGIFLSAFIDYAWVISIIASFFIKDDEHSII